jgi:hypothetical protein
MEENRIRQIKAVVTWTVLWMAVLALLSMVCIASSGLLPAEPGICAYRGSGERCFRHC